MSRIKKYKKPVETAVMPSPDGNTLRFICICGETNDIPYPGKISTELLRGNPCLICKRTPTSAIRVNLGR